MARILAIVATVLFTGNLYAIETDFELGASARSYPYGGTGYIEYGGKYILWGDSGTGKVPSPWHGYLRAFGKGQFAPDYWRGDTGLELFPLGFLGVRYIYGMANNSADYKEYNCVVNACKTETKHNILELDIRLGVPYIFIFGQSANLSYSPDASGGTPVIEPEHGVRVNGSSEKFTRTQLGIGSEFSDGWVAVLLNTKFESDERDGDTADSNYILLIKTLDQWTFAGGVGVFESDIKNKNMSVIGRVSYTWK